MKLKITIVKKMLIIGVVLLFSGCVSKDVVPMSAGSLQNLSNKTFTFVQRKKLSEPNIMTPGQAMTMGLFGGVGGAIVELANEKSGIKAFRKTPAYYINSQLTPVLIEKYKMRLVPSVHVTDKSDLVELLEEYKNVDYIIDTQDFHWVAMYYPLNWDTYGIRYMGNIKIIDVKKEKIIAKGYCESIPENSDKSPSYEQLFADDAKLFKKMTENILSKCADNYLKEVF